MAKKDNDWKSRLGMVYSTNPDYVYEEESTETETLPKQQQKLRVRIEKNHRGGKVVTIVSGFVGSDDHLRELGRFLKTKCGVGGSQKDGELLVQGDFKEKVVQLLKSYGYTQTK
ncbi:MAG: translation initiation factor [Bacteroidaceae bacterium]|nr:translation initiation factor [Bacteroidaceae bacterium]